MPLWINEKSGVGGFGYVYNWSLAVTNFHCSLMVVISVLNVTHDWGRAKIGKTVCIQASPDGQEGLQLQWYRCGH